MSSFLDTSPTYLDITSVSRPSWDCGSTPRGDLGPGIPTVSAPSTQFPNEPNAARQFAAARNIILFFFHNTRQQVRRTQSKPTQSRSHALFHGIINLGKLSVLNEDQRVLSHCRHLPSRSLLGTTEASYRTPSSGTTHLTRGIVN
jgi:hypothetical protein